MKKYQKLDYILVDNKQEKWYDSEPSAVVPEFFYHEYFNLMTTLLVSLLISLVGYQFKLLRMSWYKCMTPFRDHLHLVINKYLCPFYYSFAVIDYKSNEETLIGMSKYIIFSLTLTFVRFGHYYFC